MSEGPTLISRLRVLVAKTFKAEKLYSSIRNNSGPSTGLSSLAELSNDIRAREWQKSHSEFRSTLNALLEQGNTPRLVSELSLLKNKFLAAATESTLEVDKGSLALIESAKRNEFAHSLKLSYQLVRYKARAQALHAIADELSALLESSGKSSEAEGLRDADWRAPEPPPAETGPEESNRASNVIPLRRKTAAGRHGRR